MSKLPRLAAIALVLVGLGGCVAAPGPGYGYYNGYYAPAYAPGYAYGPPVAVDIGVGGGCWHCGGWRR